MQPGSKKEHLERIRADIREFKSARGLDKVAVVLRKKTKPGCSFNSSFHKVVVLWTANTERFTDITPGVSPATLSNRICLCISIRTFHLIHNRIRPFNRFSPPPLGVNDTADNILRAIDAGAAEIAPSTVFAVAAILEGCTFINGSPQNTLVPGVVALALRHDVQVSNCPILFP